MVAAPTLGLPERAEAGRNYDYRYVWIRDQAYAGLAVSVLEPLPLLDEAVGFATARLLEDGDKLRPAYRVDGTDVPPESTLGLPGYPGGRDVVGNWVRDQFQLDTLGEILQLLAAAARHDRLDTDAHRAIDAAVAVIESRWDEPDAGIWELDNAWWTHSRLACVGGLSTLARYLPASEGGRLTTLSDTLLAETSRRCLDPRGFWRRSPEHRGTDAALLLPPVRGALPATDPRTVATLAEVEGTLTQDGYVYRFAADARRLGEAEGAFLLCGFTMAMAYWHQGDQTSAFRWFERNRAACGPPGLLSEEYDVQQRQLRGNIPQAFVHAALLEASLRLAGPESSDSRR
jgi:GH15 family glucan-1,4-alpha-glucosidase